MIVVGSVAFSVAFGVCLFVRFLAVKKVFWSAYTLRGKYRSFSAWCRYFSAVEESAMT